MAFPGVQIAKGTKILFVWPNTRISVWDVANGYRTALSKVVGEECIRDYRLDLKSEYHVRAMITDPANLGPKVKPPLEEVALRASQAIINEVIYFDADLVLIVSGFGVHPVVTWSLHRLSIPTAVILTESPYDDDNQMDWCTSNPDMRVFTMDSVSAVNHPGWVYLPHSHDPVYHRPVAPVDEFRCDVMMVGTGWAERHQMLESVDWKGIDLRLYGFWPDAKPGTPLYPHVRSGLITNRNIAQMYASAGIVLNIHRHHNYACSLNPRVFEAAACGAFQLTDWRPELDQLFGSSIPTFISPSQMGNMVRWWLIHDEARATRATDARRAGRMFNFDQRTSTILIPSMAPSPLQSQSPPVDMEMVGG